MNRAGFNTDDDIRRATTLASSGERIFRIDVSIPMTVLGGLQHVVVKFTKVKFDLFQYR